MTNKEKLGSIGERIVAQLENAILSENKYDSKKDMVTQTGVNIEVKTQNRHPNNSFTINVMHKTNFNKCLTVDRLIFVEYDHSNIIKVFECTDRKYNIINTKPTQREPMGRIMACFPINKMVKLAEIDNPTLATEMRALSSGREFNKNSQYSTANNY